MRLTLLVLLWVSWAAAQRPVRVTVYYEALHEDSRKFIVEQLKPVHDVLAPTFMLAELVPYGKARHVESDPAKGPTTFTFFHAGYAAQHDASKLHACALRFLSSPDCPRYAVAVISCALATAEAARNAYGDCFRDVDFKTKSSIHACATSLYGDRLLAYHGKMTHARHPPLRLYPDAGRVPRIELEGIYSAYAELEAQEDLKRVVCRRFRGEEKARCKNTPTPARPRLPPPPPTAADLY